MKNIIKWLGIVALVAAIGFSMAACDDGSGGGGNGGSGGTFTITNIPSQYNGKYVSLQGHNINETVGIFGYDPGNATYPKISGGKVSIPLWTLNSSATIVRYSGSDTFNLAIFIVENSSGAGSGTTLHAGTISSVKVSNGSGTTSYNGGLWSD